MTTMTRIAVVALLAVLADAALAQSKRTDHTYALDDPDSPPAATLADASFLVGNWVGEAFGSAFEQAWNPPTAGSMVGFFKLMNGDEVAFYELLLLVEEEGSLSLKVKHFSADFTAWETKEDYLRFRYIMSDENEIHFSGISFYRIDDDTMHGYLVMRNGGEIREEKLIYRRAQ